MDLGEIVHVFVALGHRRFALLLVFGEVEDFVFEVGGDEGGEQLLLGLEVDGGLLLLLEGLGGDGDALDGVDLGFVGLEGLGVQGVEFGVAQGFQDFG